MDRSRVSRQLVAMQEKISGIQGLTQAEVISSRERYGSNKQHFRKENRFIDALKSILKEPMVIILLVASSVYFISGNTGDGIFLSFAIIFVSAISLYQDSRSRNALEKLKAFNEPASKVIREGEMKELKSEDLVVGDCLVVEEGTLIAADGIIIRSNDFSVNEAVLTGESLAVLKDPSKEDHFIYHGTTVATGLALATITAIGDTTRLGKIGKSLENIKEEKTPLELQIRKFVSDMVIVGTIIFMIVWAVNYFHSRNFLNSLLEALTLAMSILPEEIPVAFSTFMALGAWRLMKMGIVVKQMKTVETLGSATTICTDKTGTLTENKMSLAKLFVLRSGKVTDAGSHAGDDEQELIAISMWASEPVPFDPMEVALHEAYKKLVPEDQRARFSMIHEYPLGGKPPMMTHIFQDKTGKRIIAAKGAPEALIAVSGLSQQEKETIESVIQNLAAQGYRLLGVAEAKMEGNDFPAQQQDFRFSFKGIVAFYDPPKENIRMVLEGFYQAGINVKIVTGDNALTTRAIADKIGFKGSNKSLSGEELMKLSERELETRVQDVQLFTRMFPDAKLRVINALKARNEVVAMTGDGVNDGPALKAAHIGIAMGKKGTEIAKQAASLILAEDDLSKMLTAIATGRKIYSNLKKAIRYIISIHIPIILTVFVPLIMGWIYPNILSPVHIIFLELIMGPTCSIIYENEPMERNAMVQNPRVFTRSLFDRHELITSVVQGLVIAAAALAVYQFAVSRNASEATVRSMIFVVLISANTFLTLVNRSFYYSIFTTLRYKNKLVWLITGVTTLFTAAILFAAPLRTFFEFDRLSPTSLCISIFTGFLSVIWFEAVKYTGRQRNPL